MNASIIDLCKANDIRFICLPPNSTHLTQPLDLAFPPYERAWRKFLLDYKVRTNKSPIAKNDFPKLLKELLVELELKHTQSVVNGFRKGSISPLHRGQVLVRLLTNESEVKAANEEIPSRWSDMVLDFLKKKRGTVKKTERKRKKR